MAALLDAARLLACPVCRGGLVLAAAERGPGSLRCEAKHSFDVARTGAVTLLHGRHRPAGDTADMLAARAAFLGGGHYAAIASALDEVVVREGAIVDLAAGTGWYAAQLLATRPAMIGVAIDASAAAGKHAAKAHPQLASVIADAQRALPVKDHVADAVLSIFGPREPAELARILAPGGTLVVVTPNASHLAELRGPLGMIEIDPRKDERLEARLAAFTLVEDRVVERSISLDTDAVRALVMMGPSAYHVEPAELEQRIAALPLPPGPTTLSVRVTCWRAGAAM